MQVSGKNLSPKVEEDLHRHFISLLADVRDPALIDQFLSAFLSDTEQTVLAKRLGILLELNRGTSYKRINKKLKVSSATISNTSKLLELPVIREAIEKVEIEDWAHQKAKQVLDWFKRDT